MANNQESFVTPPEFFTIVKFLEIIGHEVQVVALGKFYIKHLPQPWQTLCKYLHPTAKNKVVPDPRYTKLIINHILAKYPKIPKRITEPHHNITDDDVVGYMISSVRSNAKGMRIPDELLTEDMKKTEAYKWYDDGFRGVEILMTQPSPIVSSQGTHRTFSAPRSPKPKRIHKKKGDQVIGESSETRKRLKIKITTKKPDHVAPVSTTSELEKYHLIEAEQVSLLLQKVLKKLKQEKTLKWLQKLLDQGSQKERPEEENDDDKVDDADDDSLIRRKQTGILETKEQKKQTPTATPPISLRIDLYSE
ncbi:hypothetical protein Tco_0500363 [Tanacetum coccineum]